MKTRRELTAGFLFAGIGGFELAATWAGIKPVWSNEIDPFACRVLNKNFDHEIIEKDIRQIGKHNLATVDIICGGVPCQPASLAGKRKGTNDDRWLWPEAIRVVSELKPSVAIFENPPGILSLENGRTFQQILIALENEGYQVEIFNIPACGIGAWHQRERIWIIAYSCSEGRIQFRKGKAIQDINGNGENEKPGRIIEPIGSGGCNQKQAVTDPSTSGLSQPTCTEQQGIQQQKKAFQGSESCGAITKGREYWQAEPRVGRMVHGLSSELDENLKYYEGNNQEKIAKADQFRREVLREMWINRELTEASSRIYGGWSDDIMSKMSHRRAYERWILGKGIKENKDLRDMWDRILAKSFKKTRDLQSKLLERIREIECTEKVGQNRINRIKGLGNAIFPQVSYEIFQAVLANNQQPMDLEDGEE